MSLSSIPLLPHSIPTRRARDVRAVSAGTSRGRSFTWFACFGAALALQACRDPASSVPRARTAAPSVTATNTPNGAPVVAQAADAQSIAITPENTTIGFVGSKITASHEGSFGAFEGTLSFSASHPEASRLRVAIEMNSVRIDPPRLRGHLLRTDFFAVDQFPRATFDVTSIRVGGEGGATHTAEGQLTLRGVTRQISFPIHVAISPTEVTVRSEFSINRREFGIVYNGMADDLVRDGVVIRIAIRARRPG